MVFFAFSGANNVILTIKQGFPYINSCRKEYKKKKKKKKKERKKKQTISLDFLQILMHCLILILKKKKKKKKKNKCQSNTLHAGKNFNR